MCTPVRCPQLQSLPILHRVPHVTVLFYPPIGTFVDELNSIATVRGGSLSDADGAGDRVLNQILMEMDGTNIKKNGFVVSSTNKRDQIDPALLHADRLDQLLFLMSLRGYQFLRPPSGTRPSRRMWTSTSSQSTRMDSSVPI